VTNDFRSGQRRTFYHLYDSDAFAKTAVSWAPRKPGYNYET